MKKEALRKKLWTFSDRYPRAMRIVESICAMIDKLMIVYIICAGCLVAVPVFLAFITLPEDVRTISSTIIGSVMTLLVCPLLLNAINRKKENENKRFELNKALYVELSDLLIKIMIEEKYSEDKREAFRRFISDNYHHMSIYFTAGLISNIYCTYREYTNHHTKNVKVYAKKCIKQIRQENGNRKQFMYSSVILELIKEEDEKERTNL